MQVYPDMGVAAMLKNQWPEVSFNFASLSDRKPVSDEDDLVVLAAPDPQSKSSMHQTRCQMVLACSTPIAHILHDIPVMRRVNAAHC